MISGSSPRVRGKRMGNTSSKVGGRIIPASAGQTSFKAEDLQFIADHPRECGANGVMFASVFAAVTGSSPRVRGKLVGGVRQGRTVRIIPASAGQTVQGVSRIGADKDHPRECGANSRINVMVRLPVGSSPRVRGKQVKGVLRAQFGRIIPASAGQTASRSCCRGSAGDHPRECGANRALADKSVFEGGSSPRVRGKRRWRCGRLPSSRIIPASAGQTLSPGCWPGYPSDHPRECGANVADLVDDRPRHGSSPRVRGKPVACPGWAGPAADHPRECGANILERPNGLSICGSSPRVRGKQFMSDFLSDGVRIIPASAGQT